jgi:hypothetical protein
MESFDLPSVAVTAPTNNLGLKSVAVDGNKVGGSNITTTASSTANTIAFATVDITADTTTTTAAVAIISLAGATKTRLVERLVRSIRSRGEFNGYIVVITDQKGRYNDLQVVDENIVVIYPRAQDWDDIPDEEFGKNIKMKYKRFKMLLPHYFDLDTRLQHMDKILYLDTDSKFLQPNHKHGFDIVLWDLLFLSGC